jgi:cytochrome c-type biogenesis protein CcmH/NrfG
MHFHLGSAYFATENWQFALQSFEKAAQLDPKEESAPYNAALCALRLGYFLECGQLV